MCRLATVVDAIFARITTPAVARYLTCCFVYHSSSFVMHGKRSSISLTKRLCLTFVIFVDVELNKFWKLELDSKS